jgi:predicted NAD-dependent protein-ADP-ribosyltransferase YbiA (DUF1768 family)
MQRRQLKTSVARGRWSVVPIALAGLMMTACARDSTKLSREKEQQLMAERARYPEHWFTPVPPAGAPGWEVLPQAAGPGEVILSKRNELGLLSNFAHTPFEFHGVRYESLEGFWQMMLYPEGPDDERAQAQGIEWKHSRGDVAQMVGFEAKLAGDAAWQNMKRLKIDWVTFEGQRMAYYHVGHGEHEALIIEAMRAKLRDNPQVREVLMSTGDLVLRPDHHVPKDAPPSWKYNEIYRMLRDELRQNSATQATK